MKELNIIEASNMSVGTEFKLKIDCYYSYDDACRIRDNTKLIIKKVRDGFEFEEYQKLEPITTTLLNAKFIPIQKPVSFIEAISDDKNRVKIILDSDDFFSSDAECFNDYMTIKQLFKKLSERFNNYGILKAINKGKWYVKQDQ